MSLTTRKIPLDNAGNGSVHIGPCWFVGAESGGTITVKGAGGDTLHAGAAAPYALTAGAMVPVMGGRVDVSGGVLGGEALLYFDF